MLLSSFPSPLSSKVFRERLYIASGSGGAFIMVLVVQLPQVSLGRGRRTTRSVRCCCPLDLRVFPCAGITRPLPSHSHLPRRGEDRGWLRRGTLPARGEATTTLSNLSTPAPPSKPSLRPLLLLRTPPLRLRCHCLGGRGSGLAGPSASGSAGRQRTEPGSADRAKDAPSSPAARSLRAR